MFKRFIAAALCVMLLAVALPTSALAEEQEYVLDEVIIKFHDRTLFPNKEKQYDDEVAKILKDGLSQVTENVYVVKVEDMSKNPNAVLNRFKNSEFIEYVEPNYIARSSLTPNDPDFKVYSKAGAAITRIEDMWEIINGNSVTVAVLDTGVYAAHPEFDGRVLKGYDFVNNKADATTDDNTHGTCVAGTIAARGNNGIGAAGVNWDAIILPVKVLDSKGAGTVSNIAKGIIWAADNGAKIINLSLGTTSDSATLKSAVDYAVSRGCILVAAAGNSGKSVMEYPARYDNVIGVGGDAGNGTRNAISCYGTGLDILALPSYRTTTRTGAYGTATGTSFSSPQIAGALSLALAFYPDLDAYSAKNLVAQAAVDIGAAGWDAETGYGTLNYLRFIETVQALGGAKPPADTTPPSLTLKGAKTIELVEGDTYVEPGYAATDDTDGDITHLVTVTGTAATAYAGKYTLTYTVADKSGNTASVTRTVNVEPYPEPEADVPTAPTITQVGSNPIILHLGGSPYVEQGAVAYDVSDGDISSLVTISGSVDTSSAGTYYVKYSVTNSAGLSADVTREVRVLAPTERAAPRTPYNFNDQGKAGASFTHTVSAEVDGIITLTVSGLNKTTVTVTVLDNNGRQVFGETFSGNTTRDFWAAAGSYTVSVKIDSANGNAKVGVSLLMPEVIEMVFSENEVPLDEQPADVEESEIPPESIPKTADTQSDIWTALLIFSSVGICAALYARKRKEA